MDAERDKNQNRENEPRRDVPGARQGQEQNKTNLDTQNVNDDDELMDETDELDDERGTTGQFGQNRPDQGGPQKKK